jgi:type I site-specific restriction endonuclease
MEKAKKSVEDLQRVIEETDVEEAQQATLDEIASHAQQFQEDPAAHHQTLRERLENALLEFDAEHHPIAESIRLAIYDLSNAGV